MRSISRTHARFSQRLTTADGVVLRGSIQTATEGVSGLSNFLETRQTMHCQPKEPVQIGSIIVDEFDRRFLVGYHDRNKDVAVYKLFSANDCVSWTRTQSSIEPVTGLPKATSEVNLGPIWVAMEIYGRQEIDRAMHVSMERARVLTGADIELDDTIDGRKVRRLYTVFGIKVAEIQ